MNHVLLVRTDSYTIALDYGKHCKILLNKDIRTYIFGKYFSPEIFLILGIDYLLSMKYSCIFHARVWPTGQIWPHLNKEFLNITL